MPAAEGYEALRQARIAENLARLRQKHGLLLNAGVLLGEAPQPVRNPAKRRKVDVPALPLRKSDRAKGKQAVCYNVDGEPLRPRMKASRRGGKRTSSSVDRWEPSWAIQTNAAILAATNAAHELTDKMNDALGNDPMAFSKVMMYSHVAKGFWLEAPYGLAAALGARDTMMVDLECSNTTVPVADMVNRDADGLWEAKLLMRSNKRAFGFSGGWRGFAKDQRLTMNDTVVFEVPPKTEGSRVAKPKIKLHIFRGEDYETDESWPQVKPAQVVKKDMVPSRKRAKMSIKRASPAASNAASADGSGEEDTLRLAAPTDEPGLKDSSSDGSDASCGSDSDSDASNESDADSDPSDVKDDAPGNAPTAVDIAARHSSCTSAGKGSDGADPAAGAGKERAMPHRLPASARGVASSSQGPTKGPPLATGKAKASQVLRCRTDLGHSSSGRGAGGQAVAPAAGGSKPGGGQQLRSSGAGKENQGAAANNDAVQGKGAGEQAVALAAGGSKPGSRPQLRSSGAGKENQGAAANTGAAQGKGASEQAVAPAAGGSKPGSRQQPSRGGAGKENQGTAANSGAAQGKGPGGKGASDGAEKRKGVARLGEPAGKDTQPKKRAAAPKRKAEWVDTTGWYDKVKEARREVGAPDFDQEVLERGLPKCCLKTLLFNMSIEAAEDGTLTFVHPEQPGAYADRLPTVPPVLPKAKVGKGKQAAKGIKPVGGAGSKAAAGKAAAKDSAAGTGGAGPSSSRAAGPGAAEAANAAKNAGTRTGNTDVPLPVRPSAAAAAGAGSSAASKQAATAAKKAGTRIGNSGVPLPVQPSAAAAAGAGSSAATKQVAAKQPIAKRAAGGNCLRRRISQAAAAKATRAGGSGATGSPAKGSRCIGTAGAEGKARGKVAAKDKLGVSTAIQKKAHAKKAKAKKKKPQQFLVDYILDSKVEDGVTMFLIHWLGYTDCEDTWEPIDCLNGPPENYKWKRADVPCGNSRNCS